MASEITGIGQHILAEFVFKIREEELGPTMAFKKKI